MDGQPPSPSREAHIPGSSTEYARSLVCRGCWRLIFNTQSYEDICTNVNDYDNGDDAEHLRLNYITTEALIKQGERDNCSWCALLRLMIVARHHLHETSVQSSNWGTFRVYLNMRIRSKNYKYEAIGPTHLYVRLDIDHDTWGDSGCTADQWRNEHPEGNKLLSTNYFHGDFYTFTLGSDRAARHISARPMQYDTSPGATREEIRSWLRNCGLHACCLPQQEASLPKRLVYVGSPNNHIKLVESLSCGSVGKYAALSYCWGGSVAYFLTSTNIEQFKVALDTQALPRTIQDAILVARSIPVDYVWVDSLCILQDSIEDKDIEIAKMQSIYRHAHVTIVAANADNASQGFLRTLPDPTALNCGDHVSTCDIPAHVSSTVPFRIAQDDFGSIFLQCHYCLMISISARVQPINQRAWTLQEQVLSQRLLIYTKNTLQWRCKAGIWNAGNFLGLVVDTYWDTMLRLEVSESKLDLHTWLDAIRMFSYRKLSLPEDKLPAIAGLAGIFLDQFGPGYYAGLWQRDFLSQLQWYVTPLFMATRGTVPAYRSPTWSWASTDYEVNFGGRGKGEKQLSQCLHVETELLSKEQPLGGVSGGHARILGKTRQAFLVNVPLSFGMLPRSRTELNQSKIPEHWAFGVIWKTNSIDSLANATAYCQTNALDLDDVYHEGNFLRLDAADSRQPGLISCFCLSDSFGLILRKIQEGGRQEQQYRRIGAISAQSTFCAHFGDAKEEEITIV
jgi:hypothetical protein